MLSGIAFTIGDVANGFPDGRLGYLLAFFLELLDELTDIPFAGVLHEDVQDVLLAVELRVPHFYYVLVIQ